MTGADRPGAAPGPVVLLVAAVVTALFAGDHPLLLGAGVLAALELYLLAPRRPSHWFLVGGAISAVGLVIMTPLVVSEGDLILWRGPEVALFDLEITLEELAMGVALGARLFAVAVAVGAGLAYLDPDRLQAQVSRVAPRSALICALAARLLPTLERDAAAISEAARLRGARLSEGRWLARARTAAPLALPLMGSGLTRGLDVAEAMVARGYSGGPRTRLPEAPYRRAEWWGLAIALTLAIVAAWLLISGAADYRYYPTMESPWSMGVALVATALAGLVAIAGRVLGRLD